MNDQQVDQLSTSSELRQELSRKRTDLESSATFLTFEPGLYAIDFRAVGGSMSDVGLPLPCARLEAVPNPASPGRVFVSMIPEGGWLSRTTAAAHVLVVGGRGGAVLTIYRPTDGTPMPEVQFRSVLPTGTGAVRPAAAATAAAPRTEPTPMPPPGDTATLLVHLEGVGDRTQASHDWVGDTAGERSIEGFALSLPAGMDASSLEYQGIMGEDWRTPWFEAGAFCGSRGLQLPLLGFRLRLIGQAAEEFEIRAYGHFVRNGVAGPVGSGEDCHSDNMPMTAMKVELLPKAAPAASDTEAVEPDELPSAADAAKKPRWRRPKS